MIIVVKSVFIEKLLSIITQSLFLEVTMELISVHRLAIGVHVPNSILILPKVS